MKDALDNFFSWIFVGAILFGILYILFAPDEVPIPEEWRGVRMETADPAYYDSFH